MQYNITLIRLIALVIISIASLTSCIREQDPTPYDNPEDVLIQLQMSRADTPSKDDGYVTLEHEDNIDVLHVLLFTHDTKEFIEVVEAVQYGLNEAGTNPIYKVGIKQGRYHMVLLANCAELISESGIDQGSWEGYPLEDVCRSFTFNPITLDGKWVTDTSDPDFRFMPMWGEKENVVVSSNGADLTGPDKLVPMIRMMARIDVKLSDELAKKYQLNSIHLYNWRYGGRVVPTEGAVEFNYSLADGWKFTVKESSVPVTGGNKNTIPQVWEFDPAVTSFAESIYAFETEAKDYEEEESMNYTCLVLGISRKKTTSGGGGGSDPGGGLLGRSDPGGGMLGGDPDPGGGLGGGGTDPGGDPDPGGWLGQENDYNTYYYRVDFIDSSTGEYMGLLRNHQYVVTASEIINQGFPDVDQAFRSQRYDFNYTVKSWQEYNTDVDMPGTYRLDISQTLLELTGDDESVFITTTHPDGWSAYLSKYPDRIEYSRDLYTYIVVAETTEWPYYYMPDVTFSNNAGFYIGYQIRNLPADKTFALYLNTYDNPGVDANEQPITVQEYIHIVSGNMTNVITVKVVGYTST